jgi:hypothetical protein
MDTINTQPDEPSLQIAIRTLTGGGFTLEKANRFPGYALIYMHRYDEFGVKQEYCFALFEKDPEPAQIQASRIGANHHNSELVIVSPKAIPELPGAPWNRFLNLFGGPVYSYSPLEPEFGKHLIELGFNKLPAGLEGKPDDLFEVYVHKALEFIFGCRVHRYGQERRFEARPDGVVLQDKSYSALYDAKAYSNGYDVTLDSIRQFGSYVTEFRDRYNQFFELNTFIVVSGSFSQSSRTLETRSRDFLALANVPLAFMTADTMVAIVRLLSDFPSARRSINWRRIMANTIVRPGLIEAELDLIGKDNVAPQKQG